MTDPFTIIGTYIIDRFDILLFRIARRRIRAGWGYCDERVDGCGGCRASDVQDWLKDAEELIRS